MSVLFETSIGNFVVDLYLSKDFDKMKAGKNFLNLCKSKSFHYNLFYNIQPNFIQSGDPTNSGNGGACFDYNIKKSEKKYLQVKLPRVKHQIGTLSLCSPNTKYNRAYVTSQFFISVKNPGEFDGIHVPIGLVAEGMEIVEKISKLPVKDGKPMTDIFIIHTTILDDPFESDDDIQYPNSPEIPAMVLNTIQFSYDDVEILSEEEQKNVDAFKSAKTLEMLGDLPYASITPPEHNLFVCKLNPATTEDDLRLLFGRFGELIQCKIVRDRQGNSKGFCFIEFTSKESCEQAYIKMNNIIVDERRIKVDFAQNAGFSQPQHNNKKRRLN
eukprot:NODE_283_length_10814_cov_0.705460.p4 type:complete len:327 gc:universal NODE_283_length_10814_cov_0.705460:6578-5598(-)